MIESFRGEYAWLSNMTPVKITYDGIEYPSVEHAYMSAKSNLMEWKSRCADGQISARQIKQESRGLILRDAWHEIKLDVMRECIDQKFSQEPYKSQLKATADLYIQEGNWWNDTFWGVVIKTGVGENNLGKLIMEKRSENKKGVKTKTNKLIADFISLEPYEDSRYGILWSNPIKGETGSNFILKFDTSWDWLMTVVEKIESIKDDHHGYFGVYINSNSCTIQGTNLRLDEPMAEPPIYYGERVLDTKLNATYQAVVDFIKWYNKK